MNNEESRFRDRLNEPSFDGSYRSDHRELLRQQMLEAFDTAQAASSRGAERYSFLNWRQFMNRPITRFAAAALLLGVVCSVFGVMFHSQSTLAFASLVEPILKAKSARFNQVVEGKDLPKQTIQTLVLEPNRLRMEMPTGQIYIMDWNVGKMMILTPDQKSAMLFNQTDVPKEQTPANFFDQLKTGLRAADQEATSKRESLGRKQIAGREAIGFRLKTPVFEAMIWGDPKTGLPILVEMSIAMLPDTKVTMTDFEFDVALDEVLFKTDVPTGYTLQQINITGAAPTETDLIAALKLLSDNNEGRFPDAFDNGAVASFLTARAAPGNAGQPDAAQMSKLTELVLVLNRGIAFAVALPADSKARYAGKGIKRADTTAPVFWYQPAGTSDYRVIYADLSAKAQKAAPESANAVPVNVGPSVRDRLLRELSKEPASPVRPGEPPLKAREEVPPPPPVKPPVQFPRK